MDFEKELDKIVSVLPRERRSFLFSATMTSKVKKLQRASLKNPAKVEVSEKYSTVDTLVQNYVFIPAKHKVCTRLTKGKEREEERKKGGVKIVRQLSLFRAKEEGRRKRKTSE